MKKKFLFGGYIVISFVLFFYSYTQVDLNLTLSKINVWQTVQQYFQHIGYFNRPVSTIIYLLILLGLFLLYGLIIRWVEGKYIARRTIWKLIFIVMAILFFSYPAFSYDIFNYLFAAKEIIVYHKNPYLVTPQQFGAVDNWILFMRWIHLSSAYTPLWIILTLPVYLLGFGFFLPILFSMKLAIATSFLLSAWLIEKTLKIVDPSRALLGLVIFVFNPLVLIEAVVSPHNDMLMMTAIIASYYFCVRKQKLASYFFWSVSVALKLMTIVLFPLFFIRWKRLYAVVLMTFGLFLVVSQREVLPWYLLWVIPFVALLSGSKFLLIISTGASLGLLLRYAPYLYLGNWDPPADAWKWWLTMIPLVASIFLALLTLNRRKA